MLDSLPPAAARIGGLATGILLPLLLAGLFAVAFGGGLSDTQTAPEPVYIIE
jgi:hypothetical protein